MTRQTLKAQENPLDEEERQLLQELEAGEWISDSDFSAQKSYFEQVARKTLSIVGHISHRPGNPD